MLNRTLYPENNTRNIKRPKEHELKFVFSSLRAHNVLRWLKKACKPDITFPVGIVSSIYYDSRGLHFLREKNNSDFLKANIRLRSCIDLQSGKAAEYSFAEIKYKIGSHSDLSF